MKRVLIVLFLLIPIQANAKTCDEYYRSIGAEIRLLFYDMRQLYLENILPHYVMDQYMTEIHLIFNDQYTPAFNRAMREDTTICDEISEHGITWVNSYRIKIIDGLKISQRNR